MVKKRRTFSKTFKSKVALEAIEGIKSITEIAAENDIHPQMVTLWKKELMENAASIFERGAKNKVKTQEQEEGKLYKKIGQLQMEVDFLKKCAGSLK